MVGLDNFATGQRANIAECPRAGVAAPSASRFRLDEGDIREPDACARACAGVDVVLHQAALGSVPRSINDPLRTMT